MFHALCRVNRALSLAELHVRTDLGQCSREAFAILVMAGRGLVLSVKMKQDSHTSRRGSPSLATRSRLRTVTCKDSPEE